MLGQVLDLPEAERPLDAAAWVRCEQLQEELRGLIANWRSWPPDGRDDASVEACCLLLAAVDAAPAGLEASWWGGGVSNLPVWCCGGSSIGKLTLLGLAMHAMRSALDALYDLQPLCQSLPPCAGVPAAWRGQAGLDWAAAGVRHRAAAAAAACVCLDLCPAALTSDPAAVSI